MGISCRKESTTERRQYPYFFPFTLKYFPSTTNVEENLLQFLWVNWLLSGSLCNCSLQISQACDFDMLYFAASFLNDNPSRWSFKRAIVLKKCGLIEKYFVHALQKYRIDLPLFVFLITEVVVWQCGHEYFFICPIYTRFRKRDQAKTYFSGASLWTLPYSKGF